MLVQLSKSTTLPVTVAEFKTHAHISTTSEDTLIESYLRAAVSLIEEETNFDLVTTTWAYTKEYADCSVYLPRKPVNSITSVTADDDATTLVEDTDYTEFLPTFAKAWIELEHGQEDLTITFTTGSCPAIAKQAILLAVGLWYRRREAETEVNLKSLGIGFDRLLNALR